MEDAYGYKANVKPIFTMSSSMPSAEYVTCEDSDVESLNESSLAEEGKRKKKASDSDQTNNQGKKVKKSNEVLMFLETMNEEFKEEQRGLLSEIKEQHKAKMDKEDQKFSLCHRLWNI
ncbi:Hypothetical predicted protein [Mytilus galloprovincialis]|uniref:Uncharacterized protein n=1 Tax=Mytilus galloprovincialis TaxID=29158 RepID=A0A8B6E874_MYTGA|nr:Hypothetical predicted protein [Mytilus galloprovincialis]